MTVLVNKNIRKTLTNFGKITTSFVSDRDLKDRSRRDNLRIDGIAEVENETWEQTEEILQNLFKEKLLLENISVERAHRVGNKEKNNK